MLEVVGKASVPVEPAEGARHDPAFWKDDELDAVWAFDDFENVAEQGFGPFDDTLLVARIDKDLVLRGFLWKPGLSVSKK
jgi:hypothetical protein